MLSDRAIACLNPIFFVMLPYEKSNLEELLFTNSKTDSQSQFDLKWFVFYTYPRSEKVVYKDLLMRGFNVFLPMTKTLKVWKNRQKKYIEQVLFPGYIFIYTRPSELYFITQIGKNGHIDHPRSFS